MNNLAEYYRSAYSKVPGYWVVASTFEPKTNMPCRVENLASEIKKRAADAACLFHTYAVFANPPGSGRGNGADVAAIIGVFLDIDVAANGRYVENGKSAAATVEEIKAELAAWGLPLPSTIVSTGNGVHVDFRLDKPFLIKTEGDRSRAKAFLKNFNGYAIERAKSVGWTLDPMSDLPRVKRAAGSQNWKDRKNPKPVEVLELHPDRTYAIEELERFSPQAKKTAPSSRAASTSTAQAKSERLPQWDLIAANCPFVRHCIENAACLSYPYWFALLGIAARCENGASIAHELSAKDACYSASETEAKIAETLKADGPATYAHIRSLGFDGMDVDILASRMHSPIQFGYGSEALIRLQRTNAYDLKTERFHDLETLTPRSHKGFDMAHGHTLPNPVGAFRGSSISIKADRVDYLPGSPRLIESGCETILNAYRPSGLQPREGACGTLLAHFDYLIPDAGQREHVLNYLACLVQRPAQKITSALLFVGGQGNGKSTIARWASDILGASNVKTLPTEAITNRFQADRINVQLMVLNEVCGIDRAGANGLKSWITEEEAEVEEKGVPRFKGRTPRGFILISNHTDGLALEGDDRRYAVIDTARDRADDAYFQRLNEAAKVELPAFAAWLSAKEISAFDPHAPAPESELKKLIARVNLSPLEDAIQSAIDAEDGCFRRDLMTAEDVIATLLGRGLDCRRPKPSSIGIIFGRMGFAQLDQQRVPGFGRCRFWVLKNAERWLLADPKEVAAYYLATLNPANDNLATAHAA